MFPNPLPKQVQDIVSRAPGSWDTTDQRVLRDFLLSADIMRALKAYAARILRRYYPHATREDFEDVVWGCLEDFLTGTELAQKLRKFDPTRPFPPYLYTCLKYFCSNAARNMQRRNARHVSIEDRDVASQQSDPLAPVELERVQRALNELPEQPRQLLIWVSVDELTHKEIEIRLGITPQALNTRLHRARAALKERLKMDEELE